MASEHETSKTRKTGVGRGYYWIAALIPPVAVFLSTERLRTRVVSVALALVWGFGWAVWFQASSDDELEGFATAFGLMLVLPSIIHAVLTVREARRG